MGVSNCSREPEDFTIMGHLSWVLKDEQPVSKQKRVQIPEEGTVCAKAGKREKA